MVEGTEQGSAEQGSAEQVAKSENQADLPAPAESGDSLEEAIDALKSSVVRQREVKASLNQKCELKEQLAAEILQLNRELATAAEDTRVKRETFEKACGDAGLQGHLATSQAD